MAGDEIAKYWAELVREQHGGEATEHSFRPALKRLTEALGPGIHALNDPKRVACGAPDFSVNRGAATLGHIETKDLGASLDAAAGSTQLTRYREALPNLILTNYLEFRWFVAGEPRLAGEVGRIEAGKLRKGESEDVLGLLRAFLNAPSFQIANPMELARRLAGVAQLMRTAIAEALAQEGPAGHLHEQMAAFQRVLLQDLTAAHFADMYAQTLCYGLFSARSMHAGPAPFTRQSAPFDLPRTNPFLRWLFGQIAGPELDERITWTVDLAVEMLDRTDIVAVLRDFGRGEGREDPVFHFYESFLSAYDPALRARRGVYYTPQPVVRYIVRAADEALEAHWGLAEGLADANLVPSAKNAAAEHRVLMLDPAAGTGAFLHEAVGRIQRRFAGNAGLWPAYVERHLLPRLFGFELLMAPYAVAHFKLGLQLQRSGYDFASGERLGVFLTNALEEPHVRPAQMPMFTRQLAEEADAANRVKRDAPVMVILGNPPYAGHSANLGNWMRQLLRGRDTLAGAATHNYFASDGKPLEERNPKWLNDDYVKFLRWAQWRIERTGSGLVAFITNNGYLENPTFRGMRQALLEGFDEIYILNLHGDSKKRERAPDGGKDENVFDIQQGVAIGIFVKHRSAAKKSGARVHFHELWGVREELDAQEHRSGGKYHWLDTHGLRTTPWKPVRPRSPLYLFTPQSSRVQSEYERGWLLTDAMPVNVLGFQTHRDDFAVAFERRVMEARVDAMRGSAISDRQMRERYHLEDTRDWRLDSARKRIRDLKDAYAPMLECLYRPLDRRWCYYDIAAMEFPRKVLLEHVAGRLNLCLNTVRQTRMAAWQHALVSDCPAPALYVELKDGSNLFPLYLYDGRQNGNLFYESDREIMDVNYAAAFVQAVEGATGLRYLGASRRSSARGFNAEQLFAYCYAVLNSPAYAARYGELLRRGWPRVPLTSDAALFRKLARLGEGLIAAHLLRGVKPGAQFPEGGDRRVRRVEHDGKRVWINDRQYFLGVSTEIWEANLGGYAPAGQWLKDRMDAELDFEAVTAYRQLIGAMQATLRLRQRLDDAIPRWPLR